MRIGLLRCFGSDEPVIGDLRYGRMFYSAAVLREMYRLEALMKILDVVGARKDVVEGEPGRPEGACQPGVASASRSRVFAGDIEIDDADDAAGAEQLPRPIYSGEPIGDHGKRVGEGDDVDCLDRWRKGGRIGLHQLDVGPS